MPYICFMPPWWPIYLFLGAEHLQLPCRVIFVNFCSNSTKIECCFYGLQHFWVEKFFGLGFNNVCLAEGQTAAAMCVKWWLQTFHIKVLKTVTCLVATVAASGEICKILGLFIVHTKIVEWLSQMFLVFFFFFPHHEKVV